MNDTDWTKASASAAEGQCVEQRRHDGMIEVRDTKDNGQGPTLRFTATQFAEWLDGAEGGRFNHLTD